MIRYLCFSILLALSPLYSSGLTSGWVDMGSSSPVSIKPLSLGTSIEDTRLRFELDGYHMIRTETPNGIEYIIDIEGGTSILDAGSPDIDKLTTSVIIPDDSRMSVNVISSSYEEYTDISVAPSKGNFTRDINPSDVPYTYGNAYNENEFYPGNLAELRDPYIIRDLRGQTVVVYPVQYNPMTKTLRVYTEIELEVVSEGMDDRNVLSRPANRGN